MTFKFFPAFFDRPTKIKFADQEQNEYIELFLRQHWATNVPWIFTTIIAIALPYVLIQINSSFNFISLSQIPSNLSLSLLILWYMLISTYVIERFLHWYFNIYIVTNTHLVDINFHNLMNRDFVEVRLDDVQSAKSQIIGIFGHLFNFGNLHIETSAERQKIEFTRVPKPDTVKERIQDLQETREGIIKHDH